MKPNTPNIAEIRRLIERSAGEYFPESVENYRVIQTNATKWLSALCDEVERQEAEIFNARSLRDFAVKKANEYSEEIERLKKVEALDKQMLLDALDEEIHVYFPSETRFDEGALYLAKKLKATISLHAFDIQVAREALKEGGVTK